MVYMYSLELMRTPEPFEPFKHFEHFVYSENSKDSEDSEHFKRVKHFELLGLSSSHKEIDFNAS